MKRLLVLTGALLCMTAAVANAQMRLAWDDCGGAGVQNNQFACNSNTTVHTLASSFIAPTGFNHFTGATTELVIATNTGGLPPWWRMESGTGCPGRAGTGMASEDGALFAGTGCENPFAITVTPNLTLGNYEANYGGNPSRARFVADLSRSDTGVPLTPGVEYLANNILLRSSRSFGTGLCAGCQLPACIVSVRMVIADSQAGERILTPPPIAFATWQGGAINEPAGCPGATPTRKTTWGSVKSLYR